MEQIVDKDYRAAIIAHLTKLNGQSLQTGSLAKHFKMTVPALRYIMNTLAAEGVVRKINATNTPYYIPTEGQLAAERALASPKKMAALKIDKTRSDLYANIRRERDKYVSIG